MKKSRRKQTEEEVLGVYERVSPSIYPIEDKKVFRQYQLFRESLFRDRLHFPLQMFADAELLDFGSGTGEIDIFYALWGARVTGVELNPFSIERCHKLFRRYKVEQALTLHQGSLFDFSSPKKFDIVVSNGVLHHTAEQKRGFINLVSFLKPGGFVYISIGNNAGAFQRNLQRLILYTVSASEKELVAAAKFLFPEHIARAVLYSRRSADSIIYDSYVVPKADNVSGEELLQWFSENGIRFYSSWPPLSFPFPLVDSPRQAVVDYTKKKYRGLFSWSEYFWMIANENDREVIEQRREGLEDMKGMRTIVSTLKDVTPDFKLDVERFQDLIRSEIRNAPWQSVHRAEGKKLSLFFQEVLSVISLLKETKDLTKLKKRIDTTAILFKGYCGLGDAYYLGYKES